MDTFFSKDDRFKVSQPDFSFFKRHEMPLCVLYRYMLHFSFDQMTISLVNKLAFICPHWLPKCFQSFLWKILLLNSPPFQGSMMKSHALFPPLKLL